MKNLFRDIFVPAAIIAFFLMSSVSYAEEKPKGPMEGRDFKEVKAKILKKIDLGIASMKKRRKCIKQTKDHKDLKACRKAHFRDMKKLKQGRRGVRRGESQKMKEVLPDNLFPIK